MADSSKVLVGRIDNGYLVKVIGRGTMEFCSELFEFLNYRLEGKKKKEKIGNIYFELSETNYLDSSFIGVIVSVERKLKKEHQAEVIILNPTNKVQEILNTMGLFELIPIKTDMEVKNIELTGDIQKKLDKDYDDIKLLLESHQSLMELSSENKKKFALVEEMLKKELERKKNE